MQTQKYEFGDIFFSFINEFDKMERLICQKTSLYSGQPRILTVLMTEEGISLKRLAELTKLGMPSLSVSVRNLEKSQFVYKESVPGDNRTSLIYLTPKGRQQAENFHKLIHGFFQKLDNSFRENTPDNLSDIIRMFLETTADYHLTLKSEI